MYGAANMSWVGISTTVSRKRIRELSLQRHGDEAGSVRSEHPLSDGAGGLYPVALQWREMLMARMVECTVLKTQAEGLEYVPYPGELGQRIYENVSKEGWQRWLKHQTMLINEYRLTPMDPKARKFLVAEMEKFFFGGGSAAPKEFVPEEP